MQKKQETFDVRIEDPVTYPVLFQCAGKFCYACRGFAGPGNRRVDEKHGLLHRLGSPAMEGTSSSNR